MNFRQRVAVTGGLIALFLLGLFPPWRELATREGSIVSEFVGFGFLFDPPVLEHYSQRSAQIDAPLLLAIWSLIAAITGIAWLWLDDRNKAIN